MLIFYTLMRYISTTYFSLEYVLKCDLKFLNKITGECILGCIYCIVHMTTVVKMYHRFIYTVMLSLIIRKL